MRGLIHNGLTVLLGAALLTCALGTGTVFATDLPGETSPQEQAQIHQEDAAQQQAATATDSVGSDSAAPGAPPSLPTEGAHRPGDGGSAPTEAERRQAEQPQQPTDEVSILKAQPTDEVTDPQQPGDKVFTLQTSDPAQTTDPADPNGQVLSHQDPQPVPDEIVTAEVYVRLGGELPENIQKDDSAANYTPVQFTVHVNLSLLERLLQADGLSSTYTSPFNSNWRYYSHVTTGAADPAAFWNGYVLPSIEDASERALFTDNFTDGTFIGYVLKREEYQGFHIDGIIQAHSVTAPPQLPPEPDPPVTAESFRRMTITTSVWNAARNNPSPVHADLAVRDEVFTYELRTTLPETDWVKYFVIRDTLVDELKFATGVTVSVSGQKISLPAHAVEQNGKTLTVDFPKEILRDHAGEEICISFGAQIDTQNNVSLAKYANAGNGGRIEVPNRCEYLVWLYTPEDGARRLPSDKEPDVGEFSGIATVTPPAAEVRLEEKVNGRRTDGAPVVLHNRYDEVTYTVSAYVIERADMRTLSISDTIADVMEFRGEVEVLIGGIRTEGLAQIFDKTLVVSVPERYLTDAALQHPVTVTFRAAIMQGVDLTSYIDRNANGVRISNNASCQTGAGMTPVTSNAVQITPGPAGIEVNVNDAGSAVLSDRKDIFTYTLRTRVPERARMRQFVITDRIADVLMFAGNVHVTVGGFPVEGVVRIAGQELIVMLTGDVLNGNMGKAVIISFDACAREDADASVLMQGVTNNASYRIDNEQPVPSNTVTVSTDALTEELLSEEEETIIQSLLLETEENQSLPLEEKVSAQQSDEVSEAALKVLGARRNGAGTTELDARDAQTGDPVSDLHARESVMGMALFGLFSLLCLNTPKKEEEA